MTLLPVCRGACQMQLVTCGSLLAYERGRGGRGPLGEADAHDTKPESPSIGWPPRAGPTAARRPSSPQARVNLGAVVKRARLHKKYFVLEKDGIPVAGLMDIDAFEDHLELQDPKVRAIIAEGRREYRAGESRPARDLLRTLQARPRGKPPRRRTA